MKKIALIILTMITIPIYATTMCTKNDTVAIVLDPSAMFVNAEMSYNTSTFTWSIWNEYGTIHGIAACLNSDHGLKQGGTAAHLRDINNDGEEVMVKGGERYGHYCWCRMTHPVSSLWVLYGYRGTNCGNCDYICANNVKQISNIYNGIFASISN